MQHQDKAVGTENKWSNTFFLNLFLSPINGRRGVFKKPVWKHHAKIDYTLDDPAL